MATYGVNAGNGIPFTGYTNTLGPTSANNSSGSGTIAFNGFTQGDDRIAKMLRNAGGGLVLRRLITTLLGAVAGGTATETVRYVTGPSTFGNPNGAPNGVVPITAVTVVNRVTTAADITGINALLFRNTNPATYPADLSGNGGGGKQTFAGGGAY